MADPRGEMDKRALRLDFARRLLLQFRGSTITSDAGLLSYRELDNTLALTDTAAERLADARTGKNGRHRLAGLLRQSVFGRLAGYEDVNDAERLCRDPAMRWVVGDRAITGSAASASQMGRFETKWLSRPENLAALADLPGQWIDKVHQRRPPRTIVLDMDSSESPTYGEQEGSAYNGHFGCTCYHPLFVFNQLDDVERCALRSGNVHSADGWRAVLEPVIARYRDTVKRLYFRGDAAFAIPRCTSSSKPRACAIRSGCQPIGFCRTRSDTCPSARSGDRRRRCAATTPASATRHRAGKGRAALWPRSNGIPARRALPTSAFSSAIWRERPGASSPSTTSAARPSSGSKRVRARSIGPGCHAAPSSPMPSASNSMRSRITSATSCACWRPKTAQPWSLTSLREKLIKIGAKVVSHGRYVTFQLAEVAVPRQMFAEILSLIARLRAPPAPA
jgi:hypothetical protein